MAINPGELGITVESHKKEFLQELDSRTPIILEELGLAAESFAKIEVTRVVYDTPERGYHRTGILRSEISHAKDADSAYVGTNTEYAPYVELGTTKMAARPFIKPAVVNHVEEYKQIVEYHLKG